MLNSLGFKKNSFAFVTFVEGRLSVAPKKTKFSTNRHATMQSKNVFTTSDVIILPKKFENIIRNAVIRYIYDRGQFTNI